jgi:hypothetical protein|tara:strand:+ start:73407 stop:73595 length:189 start_codon:yes stop_codon:yes gene_type:complete
MLFRKDGGFDRRSSGCLPVGCMVILAPLLFASFMFGSAWFFEGEHFINATESLRSLLHWLEN